MTLDLDAPRTAFPGTPSGPGAYFLPSIGEYPIYDDDAYQFMMDDEPRVRAFEETLTDAVSADSVVVELGCGRQAPWARLAARLGARRVVAVEQLDHVREALTAELANDPRYASIDVLSYDEYVESEIRPTILVSEIVGAIGSSEGAEQVVGREIRRIGDPGMLVVPQGWITSVSAFSWRRMLRGAEPVFAREAHRYRRALADTVGCGDVRLCVVGRQVQLGLLSRPTTVETANFSGSFSEVASAPAEVAVSRPGTLDSLLLSVAVKIGTHSVDSLSSRSSWLPVVVPLGSTELPVREGDTVDVRMHRRLETNPVCPDYIVDWRLRRDGEEIAHGTAELPWRPDPHATSSALHVSLTNSDSPLIGDSHDH